MNLVTLTGRLAKEPTLKYLEGSGASVAKFDLAVNKDYSKDSDTKADFFSIECWNKLAESVVNNLEKGRKILIHGFLKANKWTDENNNSHKNILIVATRIEYLDYPKTESYKYNFEPVDMSFNNEDVIF